MDIKIEQKKEAKSALDESAATAPIVNFAGAGGAKLNQVVNFDQLEGANTAGTKNKKASPLTSSGPSATTASNSTILNETDSKGKDESKNTALSGRNASAKPTVEEPPAAQQATQSFQQPTQKEMNENLSASRNQMIDSYMSAGMNREQAEIEADRNIVEAQQAYQPVDTQKPINASAEQNKTVQPSLASTESTTVKDGAKNGALQTNNTTKEIKTGTLSQEEKPLTSEEFIQAYDGLTNEQKAQISSWTKKSQEGEDNGPSKTNV